MWLFASLPNALWAIAGSTDGQLHLDFESLYSRCYCKEKTEVSSDLEQLLPMQKYLGLARKVTAVQLHLCQSLKRCDPCHVLTLKELNFISAGDLREFWASWPRGSRVDVNGPYGFPPVFFIFLHNSVFLGKREKPHLNGLGNVSCVLKFTSLFVFCIPSSDFASPSSWKWILLPCFAVLIYLANTN